MKQNVSPCSLVELISFELLRLRAPRKAIKCQEVFLVEKVTFQIRTCLYHLIDSIVFVARGGYFQIRRSGGLDLTSSLEAKFGARSGQVHKIRGKIWEVLSPKDAKVRKKSKFSGHI